MTLSTLELTQMQADALDLSGTDSGLSVNLVIYRGVTTLLSQSVRLVSGGGASNAQTDGTETAQSTVMVVGAVDLNIQSRDRFTVGGVAYEVTSVNPNRYVQTVAHARALQ